MITPKDISEKTFDRTFGFGYRMDAVEDYLREVSTVLQEQLDKNKDLEHKLEVLADKLTEYRQDEESLRTALLGAQKLGDSVIRESKTKAEIILRDANIKAETIVGNARRQIDREQEAFERIQQEVNSFKGQILDIYKAHLELISTLPGKTETPRAAAEAAERALDEAPEEAAPAAEAVQAPEEEPVFETPEAAPAYEPNELEKEFEALEQEDDDAEPLFSSKFKDLQFGDSYRIERK